MADEQTTQQQGVSLPPVEQGDPTPVELVGLAPDPSDQTFETNEAEADARDEAGTVDESIEDRVLEVVKDCAELEQFMSCRALTWDELLARDLFNKVRAVLRS